MKLIFALTILIGLITVLLTVQNMLVSFVLAIVIYFLLSPIVDGLERMGFSRNVATIVPFAAVTLILVALTQLFAPTLAVQLQTLQTEYPRYSEGITKLLQDLDTKISSMIRVVYQGEFTAQVQPTLMKFVSQTIGDLPGYISHSLTTLFLAPFLGFFMLIDGRRTTRQFLSIVPNSYFEFALNLNYQINSQIGGFIRARLLESGIVALVVWIGLFILSFPYAILLALFAGVLNLIPYLGPLIGASPAIFLCLVNGESHALLFWVVAIYSIAQLIDAVFIVPIVVAKIVNLHPVTVVLVVIIGSQIMGILGMIISIPVTSVLKVTLSAIYKHLVDFRT